MVVTFYLDVVGETFYEPRHSIFMIEYDELRNDEIRRVGSAKLTARICHLIMAHLGQGKLVT